MKCFCFGRTIAVVVLLAAIDSAAWAAAGDPAGTEFQVNTFTSGEQSYPAVSADGAGGFVVVWESTGQDGSGIGVFGQRFSSAGTPAGTEFQINTYTTDDQRAAAVGPDGAGGFVVVWHSYRQDGGSYGIFGQRFNSAGAPAGTEFQVNTHTSSAQMYPAVGADGAGGFVVAWQSTGQDGSGIGVFGQRFSSAGTPAGTEFQINTYTTDDQRAAAVAADGGGGFVVAWESKGQDGLSSGIFGRRFSGGGAPAGTEFQINTYTINEQYNPAVGADGAGGFVVAWQSAGQDSSSSWGVFGQRFGSAGTPAGTEFQINTYTTDDQQRPAVGPDGAGGFVVTWDSQNQDGSAYGVFGRRFTSAGDPAATEFQINTYTTNFQWTPAVGPDGTGRFVVAWSSNTQDGSNRGIFAQRFEGAASSEPAPVLAPWGLVLATVLLVAAGFFLLWRRGSQAG